MNEARVANFILIGMFFLIFAVYVVAVQITSTAISSPMGATVSAFCG